MSVQSLFIAGPGDASMMSIDPRPREINVVKYDVVVTKIIGFH